MYMFAALLTAVAHYIYFRFIDHGFVINAYESQIDILNKSGVPDIEAYTNMFQETLETVKSLTPIDITIEVEILEKIAPGSGIGSSAASSAAAVYGVNELLGRPFSGKQLVEFAMMGEALLGGTPHADNVGPALLGGVVLVRGYRPFDIVRLPVPDNFFYAVAHPGIVVSIGKWSRKK